ncbi:MAG: hypothetical protein J1E63_05355 [Muribaculaceae bacterium]|nr:hypothetical protein [Muribaculaceae bacterium]
MKPVGQTFDYDRFKLYLKSYVGEHRRHLLLLTLLVAFLPTFLLCVFTWLFQDEYQFNNQYWSSNHDPMASSLIPIVAVLCIVMSAFAGSRMFSVLATKHSREGFLTIPASSLEKFTALFAIYCVGYILLMSVSIMVADFIRLGLFSYLGPDVDFILAPWKLKELMSEEFWLKFVILWLGYFCCILSTYAVGSALWPRHGFIMTFVATSALQIVWGILFLGAILPLNLFGGSYEPRFDFEVNENIIIGLGIALEMIYTAGCFVFCYFRMKQWEIISRW